jgi:hypothetical protein
LQQAVEDHTIETSRLSQLLGNQLTGGGETVRLTYQLPFTPKKIPNRLSQLQGNSMGGWIRLIEKFQ